MTGWNVRGMRKETEAKRDHRYWQKGQNKHEPNHIELILK